MAARRRRSDPGLSEADVTALDDLLGMMLVLPGVADHVAAAGLAPADFGVPKHQAIAALVFDTVRAGTPLDPGDIAAQFREAGGDASWLHSLIGSMPSAALVDRRIEQVQTIAERAKITLAVAAYYEHRQGDRLLTEVAAAVATRGPAAHGFIPASAVRTEAIWWLWQDRIPLGELTLLAGNEKSGKSLLCCELAARASRGQLLGSRFGETVTALYLTAEDRVSHVVAPRLRLAGADMDNVLVETVDDHRPVTLERIAAAVATAGVRFIVLDPLSLFIADRLGDGDERGDLKVRAAMHPVINLAQRYGVAIVGIKHTNKGEGRALLNRVAGSRAYTAAARALLFVADDPDATDPLNPDRLIFPRGNLTTTTAALRYRIEAATIVLDDGEAREHPRIVWRGESDRSAEEAFARTDRGPVDDKPRRPRDPDSATAAAMAWLADALAGRGEVPSSDVLDMARDEKIAARTVQRAAHELGVRRRREGFGQGSAVFWELPDGIYDIHIDAKQMPTRQPHGQAGIKASMAPMLDDELFAGATDITDNRRA